MSRASFVMSVLVLVLLGLSGSAAAQMDPMPFERIIGPNQRSHDATCALMAAWVAAHPGDPRAPRGLLAMAQLRLVDHQAQLARPLFLRVIRDYPGTEWAQHSTKGLADLELESWHFAAAIAKYDGLARSDSPFFQYVGRYFAQRAREERLRFYLVLGLLASFLLMWGVRLLRLGSWRTLWPPPAEVIYPLPVLMAMGAASFGASQGEGEGRGVLVLAAGALALLWLNGAYLRARPPVGRWRYLHGALGLVQTAGLLYMAIVLCGLWDKFHDTIEMGAD